MSEAERAARPCAAYYLAKALSASNLAGIVLAAVFTVAAVVAPGIVTKLAQAPAAKQKPAAQRQLPAVPPSQDPASADLGDLNALLQALQGGTSESSPLQVLAPSGQDMSRLLTAIVIVPLGCVAIMVGLFMQVMLAVAEGLLLAYPPRRGKAGRLEAAAVPVAA